MALTKQLNANDIFQRIPVPSKETEEDLKMSLASWALGTDDPLANLQLFLEALGFETIES